MGIDKNPYEPLVRLLEARRARQVQALADTTLQLDGAKESSHRWLTEQQVLPFEGKAKK